MRYQYLLSYMSRPRAVSNKRLNALVNTKSDYPNYTMPFGGELNIFSASHLMQQGTLSLSAFCGPVSVMYSPEGWTSIKNKELICALHARKAYVLIGSDFRPVIRQNFNENTLSTVLVSKPPSIVNVVNLDDVRGQE